MRTEEISEQSRYWIGVVSASHVKRDYWTNLLLQEGHGVGAILSAMVILRLEERIS